MHVIYLVVDGDDQFIKIQQALAEDIWNGRTTTTDNNIQLKDELKMVSVLCDDESLEPRMCFFVKLELDSGAITNRSRFAAYDAMSHHLRQRFDADAASEQLIGWPTDWQRQLAIALDVPPKRLCNVGIGGPLLMADLWGIPIDRILEYFEEAN